MKQASKASAYIGHNYGVHEWSDQTVYNAVSRALVAQGIDGATFTPCVGMWRGELEQTTRCDCYGVSVDAFRAAMEQTAQELAQWEILIDFDDRAETVGNDPSARRATLERCAVA